LVEGAFVEGAWWRACPAVREEESSHTGWPWWVGRGHARRSGGLVVGRPGAEGGRVEGMPGADGVVGAPILAKT